MEIDEVLLKIKNLLDLDNSKTLTEKQYEKLRKLKLLRNKLDPEWYNKNNYK